MFFKKIYNLGDRLEDKVRVKLSHYPIIYAFIGGVGVIIFWRGVWHTADHVMQFIFSSGSGATSTSLVGLFWWDGPLSILVGTALLLVDGLFVSSFIGNEIIISGLKKEKKLIEKTEDEIVFDLAEEAKIIQEIRDVNKRLNRIEILLKK